MNSDYKVGFIEKFGIYYLNLFKKKSAKFDSIPSDNMLKKYVQSITLRSILYSGIIGIVCVFPMIWTDIRFSNEAWYIHYGFVSLITILFTLVEFYFLFIVSLKAVHEVAEHLQIRSTQKQHLLQGPFALINILSRTALEINEPELKILGINPFKRISKKNLFLLGLVYKLKIILSNFILKWGLILLVGKHILGVSVLYEALLVEFFWNGMVVYKVIKEARLRLFGFVLANEITRKLKKGNKYVALSEGAKIASLRAIGNTIVLTKNYHPNMVMLLLDFQELIEQKRPEQLDNWTLFLEDLNKLVEHERYFVLDLLCIAAAFDGKISDLETSYLKEAFQQQHDVYFKRLKQLQQHLTNGKLHAAEALCGLDFVAG